MTFQPDGGDVPLFWGQFLTKANRPGKAAPQRKTTKQNTPQALRLGTLQQRLAIALLIPINLGLAGLSWSSHSSASQIQQARQVQALVAPTPVADSIEIQPIKEPTAVVASVEEEKVVPTPTPTRAVAAVSTNSSPLVGNWDELLQQNFGGNWLRAKKVMLCESGGNAHAVGPMDSQGYRPIGLFQIKNFAGRPSTQSLMDGATNIAYAAKMSGAGSNWSAWQCKP